MQTFGVMISSTTYDLPEHRKRATDAVSRCSMLPLVMETLGTTGRDPIMDSLNLVNQAEIYVLILGRRYGYVPQDATQNPDQISITEMEYRHAVKRDIPVLVFVMHPDHKVEQTRQQTEVTETDDKRKKLAALRDEVMTKYTVGQFQSPEELALLLVQALNQPHVRTQQHEVVKPAPRLPVPPNLLAIPPYTSNRFVGRQQEKQQLDKWARDLDCPVMVLQAIGGQGKSALAWDWMQTQTAKAFSGIIWWNFDKDSAYHPDSKQIHTFVRYAVAYITQRDPDELKEIPERHLLEQLAALLQREPYLLILDGLERLLVAYNRLDPNHVPDETVKDDEVLRDCINPQDFMFLRQLIHCQPSKVLIGTRLLPTALEDSIGELLQGVSMIRLAGLKPEDGRNLMGALGVRFSDKDLLDEFMARFDYHGLMLRLAAGHIAQYRPAPGNFNAWYQTQSVKLWEKDVAKARTELLDFAIKGMTEEKQRFLENISAFRGTMTYAMIAPYNPYLPPMPPLPTLPEVPVPRVNPFCTDEDSHHTPESTEKLLRQRRLVLQERADTLKQHRSTHESSEAWIEAQGQFDILLRELEDRGLLEWNRDDGTYDLHPMVRSFAHDQLEGERRHEVFVRMRDHLGALTLAKSNDIEDRVQLHNAIEYYYSLINTGEIKQAVALFNIRLQKALLNQFDDYPTVLQLLRPLVEDHMAELDDKARSTVLHYYALALEGTGQIEAAANHMSSKFLLNIKSNNHSDLVTSLVVYARNSLFQNRLAEAERILSIAEEMALASQSNRQLAWVHEYQFMLKMTMGDIDSARQIEHDIVLERKHPDNYLMDRMNLITTVAQARLDYRESAADLLAELSSLLETRWHYGMARRYHTLIAQQAMLDGNLQAARAAFVQSIQMTNLAARSNALNLARLSRVLQLSGDIATAERGMTQALKRWCYDIDKPELYLLAAHFCLHDGKREAAANFVKQALDYAAADGAPYVHRRVIEEASALLKTLDMPLPPLPAYDPSSAQPIPYEAEITAHLEKLRKKSVFTQNADLAPTRFEWSRILWFQVCAVCEFGGLNSQTDERVRGLALEMHGLSMVPHDVILHVYEDDSTEQETLETAVKQITPDEAVLLRRHNALLPDMGTIVLIAGEDDEGPYYAFVYCLAEEILGFAAECQNDEPFKLSKYFVKLLYEDRGLCISPKNRADIGSAYKIKGNALVIIHA